MERGRTVAAHVSGTDADDIQRQRSRGLSWDQIPNKICRWGDAQLALKSERNHSWIYFMVPKYGDYLSTPSCYFGIVRGKFKKSPNIQIQMYLHPAWPVRSIYSHSSHHYTTITPPLPPQARMTLRMEFSSYPFSGFILSWTLQEKVFPQICFNSQNRVAGQREERNVQVIPI